MGEGRPPTERRTTVAEAAEILGISAEAVRGRIRRGTIPVEREGGVVYVLLGGASEERTTGDRTDLLIAELQDRVRSLEEANRENRRIIAALTSRIPQLEAPERPPEARETAPEEEGGSRPRTRPKALVALLEVGRFAQPSFSPTLRDAPPPFFRVRIIRILPKFLTNRGVSSSPTPQTAQEAKMMKGLPLSSAFPIFVHTDLWGGSRLHP
jgi:hypothetical protein